MTTRSGLPIAASLVEAAESLERATGGAEVRAAVRDGLLGLEHHLDTLARELAREPSAQGALEPALRPKAEKVEAKLRSLLVTAWAMLVLNDEQLGELTQAKALAKDLRSADHADIALVFDQLLGMHALD